jgi:type IV secretory pathway VirB4 component
VSPLLPTVSVTTRHSVSAYPWQVQTSLPLAGPVIGINQLAGGALFAYDPWACYADGVVTSPNMVVVGQLGTGKSALVKTYLSRQCLAGRAAFVLDPKGEYAPLAAARGLPRLALAPGGPDRLNPLDAPAAATPEQVVRRRTSLVAALAAAGLGRELTAEERAAITSAVTELPDQPVLGDVVSRLLEPSDAMATALHTTRQALAASVRPTALELRRLLIGDLAGMVDAPTTVTLDPDGAGLVLDVSAVFGSDALAAVMVCAGTWLSTAIAHPSTRRRILLVDEAWAVLGSSATTRWLQSVSKLARRYGVQLVTVVHRCSDLDGQSDDGTAAQAQARGLLADAETRVVYAQSAGERARTRELFGLTQPEADLVTRLPAHRALWLVGRHAAVVDHVLAAGERDLVDTDQRMTS